MHDDSSLDADLLPVVQPLLRDWRRDDWLRNPKTTATLTLVVVLGALFALAVEFQALVDGGPRLIPSTAIVDFREPSLDHSRIPDPDVSLYDPEDVRTWSAAQLRG